MSLKPASQDISDKPGANAVTKPTDPALKEADVARKARLYQGVSALTEGKYPSNSQIEKAIKFALNNSPIDQSKLSSEGQQLVRDTQAILETVKDIVNEKNRDELVQEFLFNTRDIDTSQANLKGVSQPVSKDQATQDGQQAVEHLRTLGKLIFTNSEFRKLLKDASVIGRDIAADAATKAASHARPNEEALRSVDEAAPSDSWVGPDGERRGPGESVPDTGLGRAADKAKETKDQAQNIAQDEANRAQGPASDIANQAATERDAHGQVSGQTSEAAKDQAATTKDRLLGRIPDEHKERAKEQYRQGKDYLNDKFPEERRNRFIYRLKKVVVEQQRHRQYQEAIEFFLTLAETYHGHATNAASQGTDKGLAVRNDPGFKTAETQLRTLLERFANNKPVQPIFDAVNQIYDDAQKDEELRNWLKTVDKYVRRVLQEPGYVMKSESDEEGKKVWNNGKQFWDDKYKGHRVQLFDTISDFFKAFADDPLNTRLGDNFKKLTKDLLLDNEGGFKYKPTLWTDIREVILPSLIQHIGYVPIPRIEYVDNMLELVIENLVLDASNILPNIIEVQAQNYFKLSPYGGINNKSKHSIQISFSQVQSDMRQVAFFFRKKSGFPKIRDSGLADVLLSGKGLSGNVHIETTDSPTSVFKVKDVKVKVDKLKFSIKDSRHQVLYATLRPLATGLIKKQIAKAIQDAIRGGLQQLDSQLVEIRGRLDQAGGEGQPTKTEVLKNSFAKKADEKSETASSKDLKRNSTFKLVTKRDSKIVDWASANSLVEKSSEAQKADKPGDRWHSHAFDLESDKSSSVPHTANTAAPNPPPTS